jgi:hypothetical protein
LSVITERTVKTTKAVEPNEEDMDEPSGAQKGNHPFAIMRYVISLRRVMTTEY